MQLRYDDASGEVTDCLGDFFFSEQRIECFRIRPHRKTQFRSRLSVNAQKGGEKTQSDTGSYSHIRFGDTARCRLATIKTRTTAGAKIHGDSGIL